MSLVNLPDHLSERVRKYADRPIDPNGQFVLYWMHNALRAHENPALDVALQLSVQLGLPVFVYQGLSERYQYASDRHHAFILQGAKDVHAELASRSIGSAFHLERRGHRGPVLRDLANNAALVITEDMPVEPITGWVKRVAESTSSPLWLVDTACIIPMPLVGKAYDRAFAFRAATRTILNDRLHRPWVEQPNPSKAFILQRLPFEPIDLANADFRRLIAECDIDHAVGPVPHTLGGSRAGYARWERFKNDTIRRYADDRNNALRDGVSRLSAYLHYGMIAPMRIARETAKLLGPGPEKFLDELIIWRELAYLFCFHRPDHESLSAIPSWARKSLLQHETDGRDVIYDWERLARGQTDDLLWNAAQRSLLIQGELHNNVRMTWGKAFVPWTANARDAFRLMIDLNHRYALDGRDPASYGGLLWCLGQFDRPFYPEQPIYGTVRARPTSEHAIRLNPERYFEKTTRRWVEPMPTVAIIGAGMTGLVCGRTLQDHGFQVTLFDKGRRPGGRMSTRQADSQSFDHGAQYFTIRNPCFSRYVEAWKDQGLVAEWAGRIVKLDRGQWHVTSPQSRFVGVPGMSAIPAHLSRDLEIQAETKIVQANYHNSLWKLVDETDSLKDQFDFLVVTVPAPQVPGLMTDHALCSEISAITMSPCWALMLSFESRLDVPWDGAFVHQSPLSWAARNSSKPGRNDRFDAWVLHASPEWSAAHLEDSHETIQSQLIEAFELAINQKLPAIILSSAHRWRFSIGSDTQERRALFDSCTGLVVAGDWLAGGRIEGAFLSGVSAAGHILREVGIPDAASSNAQT